MATVEAIMVEKWTVGFSPAQNVTILCFEFADRPPINLAIPNESAAQIAKAMTEQRKGAIIMQ